MRPTYQPHHDTRLRLVLVATLLLAGALVAAPIGAQAQPAPNGTNTTNTTNTTATTNTTTTATENGSDPLLSGNTTAGSVSSTNGSVSSNGTASNTSEAQEAVQAGMNNSSVVPSIGYNPGTNTGNSGGGGGLGIVDSIYTAFERIMMGILTFLYEQGVTITSGLWSALLEVATYTPAPNNIDDWWRNPTNGEWSELYDIYQGYPQRIALGINIAASVIIFSGWASNFFTYQLLFKMALYNAAGWLYYFIGWQIRAFILGLVKHGMDVMVQVPQDPTGATAGVAGLAIIAAALIVWINFWAALVIVVAFAGRIVGLGVLTAWLNPFLAARALPIQMISSAGQSVNKAWQFLVIMTIPIGIVVSVGMSDIAREMMGQVGGPVVTSLLIMGSQLGTLLVGVLLSYGMFTQQQMAMTIGVAGLSAKQTGQSVQDSYQRQRERVGHMAPDRPSPETNVRNQAANFKRGLKNNAPMSPSGQGMLEPPRSWRSGKAARRVGAAVTMTGGDGGSGGNDGNGGGSGGAGGTAAADGGVRTSTDSAATARSVGTESERTVTTPSTGGNAGAAPTMQTDQQREQRNEAMKDRINRLRAEKEAYRTWDGGSKDRRERVQNEKSSYRALDEFEGSSGSSEGKR